MDVFWRAGGGGVDVKTKNTNTRLHTYNTLKKNPCVCMVLSGCASPVCVSVRVCNHDGGR